MTRSALFLARQSQPAHRAPRMAVLVVLVTACTCGLAGEIIVGGVPVTGSGAVVAPGASVSAQSARDLRQRATFERLKGEHDSHTSHNIVIINGVPPAAVANEWWVPTSPAAAGAAYNRARANESRVFLGDDPPAHAPVVVGVPAVVAPPVAATPQAESAARNAARANVYRQRNND